MKNQKAPSLIHIIDIWVNSLEFIDFSEPLVETKCNKLWFGWSHTISTLYTGDGD